MIRRFNRQNRLDWRDPDMPVIRKVFIAGKEEIKEILSDAIKKYYSDKIDNDRYWAEGNWKSDPTYHMKKKETKQ